MHIQDNASLIELNNAIGSYSRSLQQISSEVNGFLSQATQQLVQQKETLYQRLEQAQQAEQAAQAAVNACYAMQAAAALAGSYVSCSLEESNVTAAQAKVAECQAKYTAACGIVANAQAETANYHGVPEQRLNALATEHTQAATQKLNGISADAEDYLSDGVGGMCLAATQSNKINATKAVPISNGCGSEEQSLKGWGSRVGANYGGKQIDALQMGTSIEEQNRSCDKHDEDYYHGEDRETADREFKERSPFMGSFVEGKSESSWIAGQADKPQSELLRPTFEEEHQQCLDTQHYKVVKDYDKDVIDLLNNKI